MALGPRLDLRQSQSLVMTPQLQQAIKLLALSNLELETFIGDAIAANPLLELGETAPALPGESSEAPVEARSTNLETSPADRLIAEGHAETDAPLDLAAVREDRERDTGDGDWGGATRSEAGEDGFDLENRAAETDSLVQHLQAQLTLAAPDRRSALIAQHLLGSLDDAGYLTVTLEEVIDELGICEDEAAAGLALLQSLDPTGVGARNLSECIALQAREADRYDPCMARLIDNLDLVARGEFARLKRMCGVDDEDFADMLGELRSYDPKPGLRFAGGGSDPVTPDILIFAHDGVDGQEGGWDIVLNQATLPRLIVNRSYYLELRGAVAEKSARGWLSERLADANWLVKALDQRQKTILKVAGEIVKQQDGFFRHGVSQLKPLTLRTVAEAIEMHESTVSRVTSNKYLHCERGTFELKYFFTSGVARTGAAGGGAEGEGGASAEAVKAAIRTLIENEAGDAILSDDALVDLLKGKGFDLARRTVAKYREAIGLGSSVQRRRQKAFAAAR
ncbi:MAG: RNA polymerase factor sigma-54 [Novosphingobium sp.]